MRGNLLMLYFILFSILLEKPILASIRLRIIPTLVTLNNNRANVTVINESQYPIKVTTQLEPWKNGIITNYYPETDIGLISTPIQTTIPPNQSQLIRVGRFAEDNSPAYQLILSFEVLNAETSNTLNTNSSNFVSKIIPQWVVPIFKIPPMTPQSSLALLPLTSPKIITQDNNLLLSINNTNERFMNLRNIKINILDIEHELKNIHILPLKENIIFLTKVNSVGRYCNQNWSIRSSDKIILSGLVQCQ